MVLPHLQPAQIAPVNLDVAVIGQLQVPHLALGDALEPGPLQVIRFNAPFRRHSPIDEALENASPDPHHALVLPNADAKFDGLQAIVPSRVIGEAEEYGVSSGAVCGECCDIVLLYGRAS